MRRNIFTGFIACILFIGTLGCAQSEGNPVINLMIDVDIAASPSDDQGREASDLLHAMGQQLDARHLNATFFAPQDLIRTPARLRMTSLGRLGFELGMSGNNSNENLSAKSLSEQKAILQESVAFIESCRVCGKNEISVWGFMPQSFDQNEDTYKVLDQLGIQYNTGFQAGVIFAPGHESDVWPYKVKGHKFYAVPVSTYDLSGQKVPLQDKYFDDNGLTSTQWYDALVDKFNQIQGKNEPMAIILTKSVSGSGDYFDAFVNFLDFAVSKEASFVATKDLVNMSREEAFVPAAKTSNDQTEDKPIGISIEAQGEAVAPTNASNSSEECPTCGKNGQINASLSSQ